MKKLIYRNIIADFIPLNVYKKLFFKGFIAPFYHTISDIPLPHINQLYKTCSIKKFEKSVDFFLRNYNPVTLQELINNTNEKKTFSKPSFFLSFDDGLSEFYHIMAPILLKKGIPATCFVNTAFIDNKGLFFRYKASIIINELKKNSKSKWEKYHSWNEKNKFKISRDNDIRTILEIKYHSQHLLEELATLLEIDFDKYLKEVKPYLSTSQIKELISKGFTFGAHSVDHPDFRFIPYEEQIHQAQMSIEEITNSFNLTYKVFSFPFTDDGISKDFFNRLKQESGVDITFGCAGIKEDSVKWNIQRIPMEEFQLNAENRIKRDYFYYLIKALCGKNTIQRK